MPQKTRVPGSGHTVMMWENHVIAFCNAVTVISPPPVATPIPIQPLDAIRPIEIVTAGAAANGVITLTLTELINETVWHRLSHLAGSQDIVDITNTLARLENAVQIVREIRPQTGQDSYTETYHGCVIHTAEDGETVDITTVRLDKPVEIWYTHSIKSWVGGGSQQFPNLVT